MIREHEFDTLAATLARALTARDTCIHLADLAAFELFSAAVLRARGRPEALCCDTALPGAPLGRASAQVPVAAKRCGRDRDKAVFIPESIAGPKPSPGAAADVPGQGAWGRKLPTVGAPTVPRV